jgi:polysaccharide export outer membrane protein
MIPRTCGIALIALAFLLINAMGSPASGQSGTAAARPSYVVRPGDELEIRAHNLPELTQVVRVRPDGKISLLLLNDVEVADRDPESLSATISSLYAAHFRNPRVVVIVRSFTNFHVYVGGEVARPGLIPLGGDLTVSGAVFQAGGFKDEEGPKRVLLLRSAKSGQTSQELDLADVLERGKADVALQPGDVVYVPRTIISVYVGGEVTEPGLIPMSGRLTALRAVLKAGGFKNTAKTQSVILIRDSGQGGAVITKLNLQDVIAKGQADVELKPFDVVFVPKSKIARINQFMEMYFRQLMPVSLNAGFSYLLGATIF